MFNYHMKPHKSPQFQYQYLISYLPSTEEPFSLQDNCSSDKLQEFEEVTEFNYKI